MPLEIGVAKVQHVGLGNLSQGDTFLYGNKFYQVQAFIDTNYEDEYGYNVYCFNDAKSIYLPLSTSVFPVKLKLVVVE